MKIQVTFGALCACVFASSQEPLTLHQAISVARGHRPAYEAARLRVVQASFARRASSAFSATRLFLGYTDPVDVGGSDDDAVLTQPIDLFGRTGAARAFGNAQLALAQADFQLLSVEIQSEVVAAYVAAATAVELLKTAISVQETLQRLHDVTRLRVEGGVAPGVQLTRVGLELDQSKLHSARRQAQLRASMKRLATVIGISDVATLATGFPEIPVSPIEGPQLAKSRPDLLVLAAEVQTAVAEGQLARVSVKPEFEVQARRTPWQESRDRFGLRLQLSIPVFDGGRARAEGMAASKKAEAAQLALADATTLALGEIEAARIEVEAAREQTLRFRDLVTTARQLVERLRPGLTEQATTLLEVIDATRSLRDIEEAYVEAQQSLAEARSRFLKATGQLVEVAR